MVKKVNKVACQFRLVASRDALEVIQGKWRIPIIISLTYGHKRFGEIQRDIKDISPKMLSQELKVLEENKIITRTMYDSMPVTVEYTLTPLGLSLEKLLEEILNWGIHFRQEIVGK
jgi:DNA-binding HxlR family transcriptional regulator